MQMDQIKQGVDRVEQCADEAKRALQSGAAPNDLRQCVESMHQQARQVQQACSSASQQQDQMGQQSIRSSIEQLEQTADRAMAACRQAGGGVNPQLQQAVQKAHTEASGLKKQVQMG